MLHGKLYERMMWMSYTLTLWYRTYQNRDLSFWNSGESPSNQESDSDHQPREDQRQFWILETLEPDYGGELRGFWLDQQQHDWQYLLCLGFAVSESQMDNFTEASPFFGGHATAARGYFEPQR